MPSKPFQAVIEAFRATERNVARALNIVQRDEHLKALLSGWSGDAVTFQPNGEEPPEDDADKWAWLWSQVVVDESALQSRSNCQHLRPKLDQAKALRIIYPDGTVHAWVDGLLVEEVKRLMPKPKKPAR